MTYFYPSVYFLLSGFVRQHCSQIVKMMRYLRLPEVTSDGAFCVFVVSWLITCHILFGIVIYSAYHVAPQLIPFTWALEKGHYLTHDAYIAFVGLMVALQVSLVMDARLCSTDADSDSSIRSSCAYGSR